MLFLVLSDVFFCSAYHLENKPIIIYHSSVNADEYEGGYRININPIILAYNGTHYESLETLNIEDDKKAKDLVHLVKTKEYKLKKGYSHYGKNIQEYKERD